MTQRFLASVCASTALLLVVWTPTADAEDMDLALERLVQGADGTRCQMSLRGQSTDPGDATEPILLPDNDPWASLVTELGGATMPSLMQPVATSGPKGIDALYMHSVTSLSADADYWRRGSRGSGNGAERNCTGVNRFVKNVLHRSQLRLIKSLPFGVSLGTTLSKVWGTSLWTFGGELKIALLEGYRRLPLPDLAIRAAANTVVGDDQYTLTNLAASAILSKPFVVARIMRITPYVAYQAGVSFASSSLVDFTPGTDAFARCDPDPGSSTGVLMCNGEFGDLGNDRPFEDVVVWRHQLAGGLVFRYHFATITAEYLMELVPTEDQDDLLLSTVGRQWTVSVSPGISF